MEVLKDASAIAVYVAAGRRMEVIKVALKEMEVIM